MFCVSVCLQRLAQLPFSDSAGLILTMPAGFPEALDRVCRAVKGSLPPCGFRIIPPWPERSWQEHMKGEQPGSLGISPSGSQATSAYAPGNGKAGKPRWLSGKESACNAREVSLTPGLGRSSEGGNGNPSQYSCLENLMERGA